VLLASGDNLLSLPLIVYSPFPATGANPSDCSVERGHGRVRIQEASVPLCSKIQDKKTEESGMTNHITGRLGPVEVVLIRPRYRHQSVALTKPNGLSLSTFITMPSLAPGTVTLGVPIHILRRQPFQPDQT
jgi:hypothetical protein